MAVDLPRLAVELRVAASVAEDLPEAIEVTLQTTLDYAKAEVESLAPNAPEAVKDQAVIRLAGYVYDAPSAPAGGGYSNALRNSGVLAMLARHRPLRAQPVGDAE